MSAQHEPSRADAPLRPLGRQRLGAAPPGPPATRAERGLWTAGSLVVPLGVLAGAPVLVTAGSIALLAALRSFAAAVASSVAVGCALAQAPPLAWL